MLQITFNYDPETNIVSGVTAVGADVKASAPKTAKAKTKASSDKVILKGSSLQLNQDVLDLLGVAVGDRLCVRFNPGPVLVRPDIAKEPKGGNLITKSMTISVKGKTGDAIKEHGDEFEFYKCSEGFVCLGVEDGTNDAERQASVEDKPAEEIDVILDDIDFLSDIEDGEELDFPISIQ